MIEALTKTRHPFLDEFYVGQNGSRRVECILDNYCVRYMGYVNGKRTTRREYDNNNKELCMARALAWLNK